MYFAKELVHHISGCISRWYVAQTGRNIATPVPKSRIGENDIMVRDGGIFINYDKEIHLFALLPSNSMNPVIDEGHNAIGVPPESIDDLQIGDIVFWDDGVNKAFHRIVDIKEDKHGWYCKTKGDNNFYIDIEKVRFNDIKDVMIGIIY